MRFIARCRPQGSALNRVTVVFDGRDDVEGWPAPEGEVRVLFSRGETADDAIRRIIDREERPRQMVLVTDDRALQHYGRAAGLEIWAAGRFLSSSGVRDHRRSDQPERSDKAVNEAFKARLHRELSALWLRRKE